MSQLCNQITFLIIGIIIKRERLQTFTFKHGEKWMFNYGTAILYVQLYYLDVQL